VRIGLKGDSMKVLTSLILIIIVMAAIIAVMATKESLIAIGVLIVFVIVSTIIA